jgi:MFS-type transporter involved in bile tolerance (Atg22 family)
MFGYLLGCLLTFACVLVFDYQEYKKNCEISFTLATILTRLILILCSWATFTWVVICYILTNINYDTFNKELFKLKKKEK